MAKRKYEPDPDILALMGEEEREKLLHRKAKPAAGGGSTAKNQVGNETKRKRKLHSEKAPRKAGSKAAKSSGRKGKPSILKLMSNDGGRLQNQRAKHQTGSPIFF